MENVSFRRDLKHPAAIPEEDLAMRGNKGDSYLKEQTTFGWLKGGILSLYF